MNCDVINYNLQIINWVRVIRAAKTQVLMFLLNECFDTG